MFENGSSRRESTAFLRAFPYRQSFLGAAISVRRFADYAKDLSDWTGVRLPTGNLAVNVAVGAAALGSLAAAIGVFVSGAPQNQPAYLMAGEPRAKVMASVEAGGLRPALHTGGLVDGALSTMAEMIAASPAKAAIPTMPKKPVEREIVLTVDRGDTLMGILTETGASEDEARDAVDALSSVYDPRKLRAGQTLELAMREHPSRGASPAAREILGLSIATDIDRRISVSRANDGVFTGEEIVTELDAELVRASADISSSLYLAAEKAGVPAPIVVELIRMYSYGIDFQRDIKRGDRFEVFFERKIGEDGRPVKSGDVHYAALTVGGKTRKLWRYETDNGVDYFDETGQSMKKFLMRTPIDGARISSNFGMRKHPVLGYTKMHAGTDFAAPTGTPIYAAGDGVIEEAGWKGGYGKYVRIRHANGYKTAYAHMNGFARGMKAGTRVAQGQTIGYVGSTGRSTGPHLHYEVHVNGKKVNPRKIKVPTGVKLAKADMKKFHAHREKITTMMAEAPLATKVAQAGPVRNIQ